MPLSDRPNNRYSQTSTLTRQPAPASGEKKARHLNDAPSYEAMYKREKMTAVDAEGLHRNHQDRCYQRIRTATVNQCQTRRHAKQALRGGARRIDRLIAQRLPTPQ
jgi:hypothetical protein